MNIILNKKVFLITGIIYGTIAFGAGYYPIGNNIVGGDFSYNKDGNRLAVGVNNPSAVRVYELMEGSWTQLGNDIQGGYPENWNGGVSVSMNSSGNRIAIGYPSYDTFVIDTVVTNDTTTYDTTINTINSAQVRIFDYNDSDWIQLGDIIEIGYGESVRLSLNSIGNWLAIGGPGYDAPWPASLSNAGKVQIYSYLVGAGGWVQVGNPIIGNNNYEELGHSISIDSVGTRLAIGSLNSPGQVRIYQYDAGDWSQMGSALNGNGFSGYVNFGRSVTISSDGNRIVASDYGWNQNTGYVKVFEFDSDSTEWSLLGNTIEGDVYQGKFGRNISMNGSGDRISVGAVYSGTCGAVTSVKIYEYNSESWIQLGTDYCNIGYAVKMSSNGNFIGIANGGAIKAYKYNPRGIWFVSNTIGSNSNFGDEDNPFATIQYGINWVYNGDTVLVEPGTYYENISFNPNEQYNYPRSITLASRNIFSDDTTSISSTIIDGSDSSTVVSIHRIEENYINVVHGFTIQNGLGGTHSTNSSMGGGINVIKSQAHIKNCIIVNNQGEYGGGIFFNMYGGNSSSVLENSIIHSNQAFNAGGGLCVANAAAGGNSTQIINSLFHNNIAINGGAMRIWGTTSQTKLKNLTVSNNQVEYGASGVEILSGSEPPEILNCNIWGNIGGEAQLITPAGLGTMVTYSNIEDGWVGTGNIDNNPLFCDALNYNYSLAENSPLIGAGEDGANIGARGIGCGQIYNGPVWYVKTTGSNTNFGSSQSPFRNIAFALNHAGLGDTVLVSPGTYFENINFEGFDKVLISEFYHTENTDYIDSTIIDGDSAGSVIVFDSEETNNCRVSGFTIQNGFDIRGGGIYIKNSSPTLDNLIIKDCNAEAEGGGLWSDYDTQDGYYSSTKLTNSLFLNNYAPDGGGAFFVRGNQSATFSNLIFNKNLAAQGGGIQVRLDGLNIDKSTFHLNEPNGLFAWNSDDVNINNSIFWDNQSTQICNSNATVNIFNSNIENLENLCFDVNSVSGNIDTDPLFCNPDSGDFTLAENSPCVGAGEDGSNMGALGVGCDSIMVDPPSSIENEIIPQQFSLHQNYPNPFNPVTTLRYDLPETGLVNIIIYDMLGRQVKTLINQTQDAGYKSVIWNSTNDYGKPVSAGIYLYQIQAGEYISTKKMVLLK